MTAEHYHALHSWMDAHPTAKRCVVALDRWLPLIPFVCYPVLLCLLNVRLFRLLGSQRQAALDLTAVIARTVFVPGLTFWGGTILRDRLNLPRPYEQPGFEPLRHKETRGHSFPSRHALSASVLAMVWMYFYPKAGCVICCGCVYRAKWDHHGRCNRYRSYDQPLFSGEPVADHFGNQCGAVRSRCSISGKEVCIDNDHQFFYLSNIPVDGTVHSGNRQSDGE